MSQQLTISSLFSVFALVMLALFARAGDMGRDMAAEPSSPAALVQVEASADRVG